jgi:hypothetical protein
MTGLSMFPSDRYILAPISPTGRVAIVSIVNGLISVLALIFIIAAAQRKEFVPFLKGVLLFRDRILSILFMLVGCLVTWRGGRDFKSTLTGSSNFFQLILEGSLFGFMLVLFFELRMLLPFVVAKTLFPIPYETKLLLIDDWCFYLVEWVQISVMLASCGAIGGLLIAILNRSLHKWSYENWPKYEVQEERW